MALVTPEILSHSHNSAMGMGRGELIGVAQGVAPRLSGRCQVIAVPLFQLISILSRAQVAAQSFFFKVTGKALCSHCLLYLGLHHFSLTYFK